MGTGPARLIAAGLWRQKYLMKDKTAGGKRKGAGRPKGEPTEPINIRVPRRLKKQLVKLVRDELKKSKPITP